MNRIYLILLFISFLVINLTSSYFLFDINRFDQLVEYNKEQVSAIDNNHKLIQKINGRLSAIKNIIKIAPETSISDDGTWGKSQDELSVSISQLKQQIMMITAITTELKNSMDKLSTVVTLGSSNTRQISKDSILPTIQEMQKQAKEEVIYKEQSYETAFNEETEDNIWTMDVEDKLKKTIAENKLGEGVGLEEVGCHKSLCKIVLSHTAKINIHGLAMTTRGDFTALKKESGIAGLQKTVIYLSRKGQRLPVFNSNQ